MKTFGVVEPCLETWGVQSCAWVRGDKADPDIESLSKKPMPSLCSLRLGATSSPPSRNARHTRDKSRMN